MLQRLALTNFKNFQSAELLLGKLTVLVGTNAAGKSNIRDAFRFVHGLSRGYTLAEIIGEKWIEDGTLQWKGIRGGVREIASHGMNRFGVHVQCRAPKTALRVSGDPLSTAGFIGDYSVEIDIGRKKQNPRVTSEKLSKDGIAVFDSAPKAAAIEQTEDAILSVRLSQAGTTRRSPTLQFPSSQPVISQIADHKDVLAGTKATVNRTMRRFQAMRFLDLAPEAMRMPSIPGQDVLGDRGENLSSVLLAICEDADLKRAVLEWVRQLTPLDVVDFEFEPDAAGRVLVSLVESNKKKTSAYSASDGTLRFLAMIAALYGPKPARFYFFEEIDNGIHPTRLHLLLQLIEQRVAKGDVQVVATTHSPQLLGFLSEESRQSAALIYRLQGHPEGRIKRILDIPDAKLVLEQQNLSRLHESGWLENAVEFLEGGENDE